jgi:hypothetical protein
VAFTQGGDSRLRCATARQVGGLALGYYHAAPSGRRRSGELPTGMDEPSLVRNPFPGALWPMKKANIILGSIPERSIRAFMGNESVKLPPVI